MIHSQKRPRLILVAGLLMLVFLSCQGLKNIPNPFATSTPTPTSTFTPTPTSTLTPTPSPTATFTFTPTPAPTGVTTNEQSDGTLVIDYDNGFQLAIPNDWIVMPTSEEEMADIIEKYADEYPKLAGSLSAFKLFNPNLFRVIAINKDEKFVANGFATNLLVVVDDSKAMKSFSMDQILALLKESFQRMGIKVAKSDNEVTKNANDVEIGSIEIQQTTKTLTGSSVQARSKILLFQANNKLVMVQLTTHKQFAEELFPVMGEIVDTIKLISP